MYALSLQSLFNWEFLPTAPALKFFLLCGFLVQCLKMLSKNFLTGKTRFTLGTGIVLFTAKAICVFTSKQICKTKMKSQELLSFALILKSKLIVLNGIRLVNFYYLYEYE